MSNEFTLRVHQKNAVARCIYGGNTLLAHEVGAGKTATMITAGIYMKKLGVIKKPMYVVPNSLIEQWATEFYKVYPSVKILTTTKKDFESSKRKEFITKIATNNYDAVIISHSQFEKIRVSVDRQQKFISNKIIELEKEIELLENRGVKQWTIKQIQMAKKNLSIKLEKLIDSSKKDDLLNFEELGVDYLFVDEAHNYKNCLITTKIKNVAGINQSNSQKAMDMLLKCRYFQEINDGKGITFATATPISNSMSEMFVMQRYLQPHILKKMGLTQFDSWASTFGKIESTMEITPEGGGYRMRNRFSKFVNLPELMNTYKLIADIQTSEMLDLPDPKKIQETIVNESSDLQKDIMKDFINRAERIRKGLVKPNEDNMLKLTNDAKLMAIDPRLIDENLNIDGPTKIDLCIDKVFDIYNNNKENKLTQLIFSDSGTPKKDKFNVYDEIKKQLINKGVPEEEIEFIHNAKTDKAKDILFNNVREGQVRILIGSTSMLGTGVNVQDKLIALHHLDVPWRPSDITQRNGRAIRQGNINEEVMIYKYVTKGTFDSYLWQIQEQKLKYISQVMTNKSISRSCEDIDDTVLSAAEVKAIATDNPLLSKKMNIDNEVDRLLLLKNAFLNEQEIVKKNITEIVPQKIKIYQNLIQTLSNDIKNYSGYSDEFSITIGDKYFTDRVKAGEMLLIKMNGSVIDENIGTYRGLALSLRVNAFDQKILYLGESKNIVEMESSNFGNIMRIENLANKLKDKLEYAINSQNILKKQLSQYKSQINKTFDLEETLQKKLKEQLEINNKIELNILDEQKENEQPIAQETNSYDMEM